jgi:hypothetical protein
MILLPKGIHFYHFNIPEKLSLCGRHSIWSSECTRRATYFRIKGGDARERKKEVIRYWA